MLIIRLLIDLAYFVVCVVGMLKKLAWVYQPIVPPPAKKLGSPDGLAITSPRVKLRDGRHLAYEESGVAKDVAKAKIIFVHGFGDSKYHQPFATSASPALVEELGVYIVAIDRPGYGESDPDPNQTVKSVALDIEDFADKLNFGPTFYVAGWSLGGMVIWSCLKYIPHRLAGAVLLCPAINFWWPDLPSDLANEAYSKQLQRDQWCFRVAHYLPWLTYWWNTQKWFPRYSVIDEIPDLFSTSDVEVFSKLYADMNPDQVKVFESLPTQQGKFESLHRDLNIFFGKWDFDPTEIENPFPNNDGSVHLWMGDDDLLVSVPLQRYIAKRLKWVKYHEIAGAGHLFPYIDGMIDKIIKTLLKENN